MNNGEKLSNYIDMLNDDRKPSEHGCKVEEDMEELFKTVRMVKSLKEVNMPDDEYARRLSKNVIKKLRKESYLDRAYRKWFYGIGSVAAAAVLIVALNIARPLARVNVVHAMEQAFKEVKAYHGILEIVETNAEGKSAVQSKVEVWADKDGRYYVKGLEGSQKGIITVNDGQKKWQVQPEEKEVDVYSSFPDPYAFTFELGKEIDDVKSAVKTKVIGSDKLAGRKASVVEVTPQGGSTYKIWIDEETKMPLQKQSSMEYSIQYKVSYTDIDFKDNIPKELLSYSIPSGFKENNAGSEQVVNSFEEAENIVGFTPKVPKTIPESFAQSSIAVVSSAKTVKINYNSKDNKNKVSILQKKASDEFKPASTSLLGKVGSSTAEIQLPMQSETGVLQYTGAYSRASDIISIRWQQDGFEYAMVGNTSLDELSAFIKNFAGVNVDIASDKEEPIGEPKVKVPVDLEAEKGDQKNVDAGHSPWKLDPAFVAQVFVSLKIYPEGIKGDYPIPYEDFKVIKNTGKEALIEVVGNNTPIRRVYLKRLIRQDSTGIWTVVGYDPVNG